MEFQFNHLPPFWFSSYCLYFQCVYIGTEDILTYINVFYRDWTILYCTHLNNFLIVFNLRVTHSLVNFSCHLCTLIFLLIVLLFIFLHIIENRHSFGVSHIIIINSVVFLCEYHIMFSRCCINHYKLVSVLGVVYNTIFVFRFLGLRILLIALIWYHTFP